LNLIEAAAADHVELAPFVAHFDDVCLIDIGDLPVGVGESGGSLRPVVSVRPGGRCWLASGAAGITLERHVDATRDGRAPAIVVLFDKRLQLEVDLGDRILLNRFENVVACGRLRERRLVLAHLRAVVAADGTADENQAKHFGKPTHLLSCAPRSKQTVCLPKTIVISA
jgi:hypothetical protein